MSDTPFPDEWLLHSLEGVITAERVAELRAKGAPSRTLWEALVAEKIASNEQILAALSTRFRLKIADVHQLKPDVKLKVPEQLARRFRVLPLTVTDSYLEVATANPFDLDAEKALAFATAREIRMLLLDPTRIGEKLDELYRPDRALDKLLAGMQTGTDVVQLAEPEELTVSAEEASQRPVVRLVDLIISEGILSRASDLHIEPEEGGVAVRYRIDGVLRQVMKIPRAAGIPLISRIKIMSSLDIADRLRPQDGRARVAVNGQPIDLRISTLPAALDPAPGPERGLGGRDPRSGDRTGRRAGVSHGPPRPVHAAHQRRRQRGHATRGHRRGSVQDRRRAARRHRAAPDAPAVPDVQGSLDGSAARAAAALAAHGNAPL